jgi:hypothetical protein
MHKASNSGPLGPTLVLVTSLSSLDLIAPDDRGMAVHRPARLLSTRWLSMRNGIAGGKRHVDGGIVLFLLRVFAHGLFLFYGIKTLSISSSSVTNVRNRTFAATFPLAPTQREECNGYYGSFWLVLVNLASAPERTARPGPEPCRRALSTSPSTSAVEENEP